MYCYKCGKQLADGSKFCSFCGTEQIIPSEKAIIEDSPLEQPEKCDYTPIIETDKKQENRTVEATSLSIRGMKWFKFIVNIQLWLAIAMSFVNGINYISGSIYGEYKDSFYKNLPGAEAISIGYGIFLLALAVYFFYTRRKLVNYEFDAPQKLHIAYIINIIHPLAFVFLMCVISGLPFSEWITESQIVQSLSVFVLLIINIKYFDNRKNVFVNPSSPTRFKSLKRR